MCVAEDRRLSFLLCLTNFLPAPRKRAVQLRSSLSAAGYFP